MAASIMATVINVNKGKGGRTVKPEDLHPLAAPRGGRRRDKGIPSDISILKKVFIDRRVKLEK